MPWASQVFCNTDSDDTAVQISAKKASFRHVEETPVSAYIEKAREHWGERIPGETSELLAWCLAQDADTLRGLLAFCVAQTVKAVKLKHDRADSDRLINADELAAALNLDMAAWFTSWPRPHRPARVRDRTSGPADQTRRGGNPGAEPLLS